MARKNINGRKKSRETWSPDIKTLDGDPVQVIYRQTPPTKKRKNDHYHAMEKLRRQQAKLCPINPK